MGNIVETKRGETIQRAGAEDAIAALDEKTWRRHGAEFHFSLVRNGRILARCSIWTESTPLYLGNAVGVVGHYAAADGDGGAAVLKHATERLKSLGFHFAVGPMDGNTWRRYRLLTERGSEPAFFLEPDNPVQWPEHFTAAGFHPIAQYFSALNDDLTVTDARVPEAVERLRESGARIRQIDADQFEDELRAVHELSVAAFADNFLYTPIDVEEFLEMYAPLRAHLRPELVLLAEKGGALVGFIFSLPDLLQAQRGQRVTTAIAKSMAVRPGRMGAGLGSVLMDQFQQNARGLGFSRVIHALMHEDNRSMKISGRFGRPFRQYTLYGRDLTV